MATNKMEYILKVNNGIKISANLNYICTIAVLGLVAWKTLDGANAFYDCIRDKIFEKLGCDENSSKKSGEDK